MPSFEEKKEEFLGLAREIENFRLEHNLSIHLIEWPPWALGEYNKLAEKQRDIFGLASHDLVTAALFINTIETICRMILEERKENA